MSGSFEQLSLDDPIYVAGHGGLVGSAIWRRLQAQGFRNLIGWRSSELDLRDAAATTDAVVAAKPKAIVVAAAKVGGILANDTYPVDFLQDNLRVQSSLFQAAHTAGVHRLLFLGSSCIYPKLAEQPIREEALLTGALEPTNEAYAIAKIAGIVAVRSYRRQYGHAWISAMPTNLYGPGDNFDPKTSHVLPAMIRRLDEAKQAGEPVTFWGSGTPRREFLHVDDLAIAVQHLLQHYDGELHINVGTGQDLSIKELAGLVAGVIGFEGEVAWDPTKPDGTPRKLLDIGRLRALGWAPTIDLPTGIASTYRWYLDHLSSLRT